MERELPGLVESLAGSSEVAVAGTTRISGRESQRGFVQRALREVKTGLGRDLLSGELYLFVNIEQLIAAFARKCKELEVFKGIRDEVQQTLALIETLTKKQSTLVADPSKNQTPSSDGTSSNDGTEAGRSTPAAAVVASRPRPVPSARSMVTATLDVAIKIILDKYLYHLPLARRVRIIDEVATFITSANFTSAAQTRNVELGVVVRDPEFATRAAAQWRSLAARRLFLELGRT